MQNRDSAFLFPPRRAFTLIELLIVVAIIAILAAIAVPNFLEAQVRSKVSRVKNDMRTLTTAVEAYYVDYNSYTNDSDGQFVTGYNGFTRLTTPVAYITSLAKDPFQDKIDPNRESVGDLKPSPFYQMGSGSDQNGWNGYYSSLPTKPTKLLSDGTFGGPKVNCYLIVSQGPDYMDNTGSLHYFPWGSGGATTYAVTTKKGVTSDNTATLLTYDSTNGTRSAGDIYRFGGQSGVGLYSVNGLLMGNPNVAN
jgi:prepilin-type N-terminal cleavage/methylation domain-containing protein